MTSSVARFGSHTGKAAVVAGFLIFAGLAALNAQPLEDVVVTYDQSQLLRLPRPASEVIIGNPLIADVTVNSGNLLVVTGKVFGITNMIVLDANRDVMFERRILVKRDDVRAVSLLRGATRQTYNCTPQCNPTITVGDDQTYFDTVIKATEKKASISDKAAEGAQGGSGN
jgi:Flp pilus assembly secretin CpaC